MMNRCCNCVDVMDRSVVVVIVMNVVMSVVMSVVVDIMMGIMKDFYVVDAPLLWCYMVVVMLVLMFVGS